MSLRFRPLTFREANAFVFARHRHHPPSKGCKFVLGVEDEAGLAGVAIIGRPVARALDDGFTFEVTRLCTDGSKNTCSMLYSAAARIAREMGCRRIITYILDSEPGTSLKAAGWTMSHKTRGDTWNRPSRPRVENAPTTPKQCFERVLA